jgi:two-component system cell cycle sensor histidine kinase/response regulator CckA
MDITPFQREVEAARERLRSFAERAGNAPEQQTLLAEVIEEWGKSLEALAAAGDELSRRNEQRLALAIDGLNAGMWDLVFDPDAPPGTIPDRIYLSPRLKMLIGYEDAEFPNSRAAWREQVVPEDRPVLEAATRAHLEGRTADHVVEYRVRHKDGSIRWLRNHGRLQRDEHGRPVRWTGIDWDITDRKQAEAALRLSEERFSAFMRHLPGVAFIKDNLGRYLYVNEAIEKLYPPRPDAWQGKTDDEILPAHLTAQWKENDRLVRETGEVLRTTETFPQDDGARHWLMSKFLIPLGDGGPALLGGIGVDITDQKRAEEKLRESEGKYRRLHESMRDAFVHVDMAGRIVGFNRAYEELLGYEPDELRRLTYVDLTPARWHEFEADIVARQIIPNGVSDVYEKEYVRKDGAVIPVELRTFLLRDERGQPSGMWAIVRDITERKRTEEELRKSRHFAQSILETTPDLFYLYDLTERRNVYANRELADILGHTSQEVADRGSRVMETLLHPDDVARVAEHHVRMATAGEGEIREIEYRMKHADGRWRILHNRDVVFSRTPDGQVREILGVAEDVTERRQAEAERETLARLATRLAASTSVQEIIQVVWHETERLLDWDAYYLILRDEEGTAYESPVYVDTVDGRKQTFPGELWPETPSPFLDQVLSGRPLLINRGSGTPEPDLTSFGTSRRSASLMFAPIYRGETAVGLVSVQSYTPHKYDQSHLETLQRVADTVAPALGRAFVQDALRESERRYRLLAENATDMISCQDAEGVILYVSPACRLLVGYEPDELVGCKPYKSFHPDDVDAVQRTVSAVLRASESGTVEYRARRKDGSWGWFESTLKAMPGAQGEKVAHFVSVTRDIANRKEAEAELVRYRDHLEELIEQRTRELEESLKRLQLSERLASVGTLAAGIAHEINNPVGMILLAAQNAVRLKGTPEADAVAYRALDKIIANAKRCSQIVKGVLQFARQEPTEKWPADINTIVAHAVELTRAYAQECGAFVCAELTPGLPAVMANPIQIEQVLVNLIRNAIEAGSRNLQVDIHTESAPDKIRVMIRDNGRGMTAEQKERLFDPFYTTRQSKGGTGLGLSISHGIITEHGGSMDVRSKLGHGTTIAIDLPQVKLTASAKESTDV